MISPFSGTCQCEAGWFGDDCMTDGNLPPTLKNIDLCTWEKCDTVKVIGEGFTNIVGDLSCQIKRKKVR